MKTIDCVQYSPEWYKARIGIPTSSSFDKIVTTKGEVSKQRTKYLYQLAGETITGISEETYQNSSMLRGKEMEAEARQLYQLITGNEVQEVGFCLADDSKYGASPDGMITGKGSIELKCPKLATHVEYLLNNELPTEYFQQVQGQLLVTGYEWVDFMSYYPGIKPLIIRVNRDKKFLRTLEAELVIFYDELIELVKKLR